MKMKKIVSILFFLSLLSFVLWLVSCDLNLFVSKGLEYELKTDGYHLVGAGTCRDEDIVIPKKHEGIAVVAIDDGAFEDFFFFESVYIPSSVKSVGARAFSNTGLESITIEKGVNWFKKDVFARCDSLEKVNFKGSVGDWCDIFFENDNASPLRLSEEFYINDDLVCDVVIPKEVTRISSNAFAYCSSIESVKFEEGSKCYEIGASAFEGCESLSSIQIPKSVKKIYRHAFMDCINLAEITFDLDGTLSWIDEMVFIGCQSLNKVNLVGDYENWFSVDMKRDFSSPFYFGADLYIDDEIVEHLVITNEFVASGVLHGCASIKSLELAEGVKIIDYLAFANCSNLEQVTIPSSVFTINDRAFENCELLDEVRYNGTLRDWMCISFENISANPLYNYANLYIGDELLKNLIIPDDVSSILRYTFAGCMSLDTVYIPGHLKTIYQCAFWECRNLSNLIIDEGVSYIKTQSFFGCESLETVKLPSSLQPFGHESLMFGGCTSLVQIEYNDTMEKWEMITRFNSYVDIPGGCIIKCIDGSMIN